ncbi:hypothetical protein C8J56DRAFT_885641 [Mycena floridula]|nr:hypothetical protein C8J56DRAFT_885641 [Mycena floridula]
MVVFAVEADLLFVFMPVMDPLSIPTSFLPFFIDCCSTADLWFDHNESTAGDLVGVVWASVENSGSGTKSLNTANALIAAFELEGEKREELGRVWGAFLREAASMIPSANSFTPLVSRPAAQNQVWDRVARAAAGGVAWPGPPRAIPNLRPNSNSNSRGNSRSGTPVQRVIPTSVARANSSIPGALGWTRAPKERNVCFDWDRDWWTCDGILDHDTVYLGSSSNQAPSHAFPALPTTSQKYKPVIGGVSSARRIGGGGNVPASPWGGSESNVAQGASNEQADGDGDGNNGDGSTGKGKKGKGKQKQMLFTTSFRAVGSLLTWEDEFIENDWYLDLFSSDTVLLTQMGVDGRLVDFGCYGCGFDAQRNLRGIMTQKDARMKRTASPLELNQGMIRTCQRPLSARKSSVALGVE